MIIRHSYTQDNALIPPAGNTPAIGSIVKGSHVGGDGRYYKITVSGAFGGASVEGAAVPLIASSGSGTTIADTNQNVTGSVTQGAFANASIGETMTQAVTGSTGTRLNTPSSTGTITGSVTSGTIGSGHTMTQATTGVTCTSTNAPTGTTSLTCNNFSGTADNSHTWTDGTTSGVYTPTAAPTFSAATLIITAATGAPDNSHTWTGGTSGAIFTPTAVPTSQAAFTVNAFVGMIAATAGVSGTTGTAKNQYCVITANTATDITCAAGWLTHIQATTIGSPNTTTIFWVEPNWGTQFTSGGATWAAADTYVFEGVPGGQGTLISNDFFLPGGRALLDPRSDLRNTRLTDINWNTSFPEIEIVNQHLDNVLVVSENNSNALFRTWHLTRQGITGLTNYALEEKGTVPLCWGAGQTNSNTATVDICMKPDPNGAGTKNGRLQLLNNSSGTTQTWNFNADGSTSIPGAMSVAGANGGISGTEGTGAHTPAGAGLDVLWPDSTAHAWMINNNNGTNRKVYGTSDCAAAGSAANPSIVACGSANSGAFSCDPAATGGTCQVNTTAVTANSRIFVQQSDAEGANLGVTCNTAITISATAPLLASKTAGSNFVINLGTVTANPGCFVFWIVN